MFPVFMASHMYMYMCPAFPIVKLKMETKNCCLFYPPFSLSQGPQGQHLWLTFKHLPPPTLADYYSSVKRPINTQIIDDKFSQGSYPSPSQLMDDTSLLCDNAYGYHPKDSRPAKVRQLPRT